MTTFFPITVMIKNIRKNPKKHDFLRGKVNHLYDLPMLGMYLIFGCKKWEKCSTAEQDIHNRYIFSHDSHHEDNRAEKLLENANNVNDALQEAQQISNKPITKYFPRAQKRLTIKAKPKKHID